LKSGSFSRFNIKKTDQNTKKLAIIIHVNESVAKLKTEKNKLKTINVNKLKHFFFPGDETNFDIDADEDQDQDSNLI